MLSLDQKMNFLAKMLDPCCIYHSKLSNYWQISNRTDEGLGSGELKLFRSSSFAKVVEEAYDFMNNGVSQELLETQQKLEKEFGYKIKIYGNVFGVVITENDNEVTDNKIFSEIMDKIRSHSMRDFIEIDRDNL